MDYVLIMETGASQGLAIGCAVWFVCYCINRGWLAFKAFVH